MKSKLLLALCSAYFLTTSFVGYGQGFPSSATNWPLPSGGEKYGGVNLSFRNIFYQANGADDLGSQSWAVMDINGDTKPDMVICAEKQANGISVYNPTSNPYWKVFLGTGNGFSLTATNWTLPSGGEKYGGINYSFRNIAYQANGADDLGSQSWALMDMNGDRKPDMVICAEKQSSGISVYNPTSNPYWKVYLNTGNGFSQTATNWALPAGGEKYGGTNYSFRAISYQASNADTTGSQSWNVMDMNGDGKPDMVICAEKQANAISTYNPTSSPYWKVYLNNGSGFSQTATNWALPAGGEKFDGTNYSFRAISYQASNADNIGSQSWSVMDINNDGKPDMVICAEKQASDISVYNPTSNPYWKVYLNTGNGFSQTASNWALPAGGEKYGGTNYSFRAISYQASNADNIGSQSWSVMDINGDGKPDMVICAEKQASDINVYNPTSNPYWKIYLNTGNGFSQTATNWALPPGGEKYGGINYSFRNISYQAHGADNPGSQSWIVMDMNGDAKPDMVVYAEKQGNAISVYNPTSNPYWKVYLNSGTLSTQSQLVERTFTVYPNPVVNNLNVKIDPTSIGETYFVFDIHGRAIKTGKLFDEMTTIDFSNVSSGIYFLNIDGNKETKKVVKQ